MCPEVTVEEVVLTVEVTEQAPAQVTVQEVNRSVTVATPGPQGPTGATGPAGADGDDGPQGPQGVPGNGFNPAGPFTVAQGNNDALTGEVYDPADYDMIDYWFKIKRANTAFVRKEFTIMFVDGAWSGVDGPERYDEDFDESEVEFTVDAVTGQVSAENNGTGSVEIHVQKNPWAT